ncbi:hypothetical protein PsYK624_169210 [Phanerochaete sordida]|uniref:Uncharacterized protein n=1 Tax=Phanerochaete sordida TaxID=48140 RepID=A0A9P3GSU0_9APHY|nr:hypothetical protein PsYK624_169210 [Phanerochaete sordida]
MPKKRPIMDYRVQVPIRGLNLKFTNQTLAQIIGAARLSPEPKGRYGRRNVISLSTTSLARGQELYFARCLAYTPRKPNCRVCAQAWALSWTRLAAGGLLADHGTLPGRQQAKNQVRTTRLRRTEHFQRARLAHDRVADGRGSARRRPPPRFPDVGKS